MNRLWCIVSSSMHMVQYEPALIRSKFECSILYKSRASNWFRTLDLSPKLMLWPMTVYIRLMKRLASNKAYHGNPTRRRQAGWKLDSVAPKSKIEIYKMLIIKRALIGCEVVLLRLWTRLWRIIVLYFTKRNKNGCFLYFWKAGVHIIDTNFKVIANFLSYLYQATAW